jgi:hypothetical protein
MTIDTAIWWSKRRFGCISLALSSAEIIIIWGAIGLFQMPGEHNALIFSKVTSITLLAGMLGSFGFAVAGLVSDSHRPTAFVAIVMAGVAFFICGVPLLDV